MEVADTIVVMNQGRIEQTGTPRDLYEHPANPFVMGFIGQVNKFGESFIRPHDVVIHPRYDGALDEATIERLLYLGFEVRVDLVLADGQRLWAQVTREEAERLELQQGQRVGLDLSRRRGFVMVNDLWPPAAGPVWDADHSAAGRGLA